MRALVLVTLLGWHASAAGNDVLLEGTDGTRIAPFSATVNASYLHVYLRPDSDSPEVGRLRKGARVLVTSCQPDCESPGAWAVLGSDGVTKLESLTPELAMATDRPLAPTTESLWYGRVGKSGITIFKEPRLGSRIVTRQRLSREMAFLPNAELRKAGWMERIEGGFVRARRVQRLVPSLFHGEMWPALPMAFVVRNLYAPEKTRALLARRYDRFLVHETDGTKVATDRGPLPRNALRIITLQSRPQSIPAGAKWVLIDLSQQTLTAYEGETAIYATLISAGKDRQDSQTHVGLFQVEHKLTYSDMHGEADDPYVVDRVPYTLYFNGDEALHGAYWHNSFGSPASHGCINLALADARWLFDWAPPALPENWDAIEPRAAGIASLWVSIKERATPRRAPRLPRLPQLPQLSATAAQPAHGM